MKNLLTILLLIVLAAQTSGYFHEKSDQTNLTQEKDQKNKKSGDEKKEKAFTVYTSPGKTAFALKGSFHFYSCNLQLSPVLDTLVPPPDFIC